MFFGSGISKDEAAYIEAWVAWATASILALEKAASVQLPAPPVPPAAKK
jgi:hypothetical protein